jgi:hypothetical protein
MKVRLTIDRFEGDDKSVAVLVADGGGQITIPRGWLPKGAEAGDVVSLSITRDARATRAVVEKTTKVQDELRKSDPGGDIKL